MSELKDVRSQLSTSREMLFQMPNVVGIGVGYKSVAGQQTDQLCIICSVEEKLNADDLPPSGIVPESLNGVPTDIIQTGRVKAQADDTTAKWRPAPGGVSVGHFGVTAGTLGCWVRKNGQYHILSNNHVLANSNLGNIGDKIVQPGSFDSGVEKIAELTEFIKIEFGGADNLVDCAIAKAVEVENGGSSCNIAGTIARLLNRSASSVGSQTRLKPVKIRGIEDIVRTDILNIGEVTELTEATLGMEVKKMGRTTGLTEGTVQQIDVTISVDFGNQSAFFTDQIMTGDMSDGGDSGSIVVTRDGNQMVGLLFAGSDVITIMNRAQNVFDALDITF